MKDDEIIVMCCICGQSLPFDKAIEVTIRMSNTEPEVQAVYAHSKCLDKVLHLRVPRSFDLD